CDQQASYTQTTAQQGAEKGRVVFAIADAAADMGSVTSVKVTVDGIKVHSDADGWVNVSAKSQTYDLIELHNTGTQELVAAADIKPGTYNQIRLDISKAVVVDADGEHEAKLPSNELKIISNFVVNENSTSTAIFDFIADESLHITGKGDYILAPVIKLETKENAEVSLKSGNSVEIKGGIAKASIKVGMDENGNVGIGRSVSKDAELSIEGGRIKVKAKIMIN
ncbi:DUF4382 domain-containing protein, partial [Candidatus Woesearchaeota archaeon]|nr:DUF4382 domain-containing protein [Candidatus Woesearchaeota archaeon]